MIFNVAPYKNSKLPFGYTELSYIASSGTQYINTGFCPDSNTRIVCDCQLTVVNSWQAMFCAADTEGNANSFAIWHSGSYFAYYWASTNVNYSTSLDNTAQHLFDCNKNTVSLDGSNLSITNTTFTCSRPLFICAANRTGTNTWHASMKIYSMKIYDSEQLVRDYVPCINAAGEYGLYDMVSRGFYGNSGTGAFSGE